MPDTIQQLGQLSARREKTAASILERTLSPSDKSYLNDPTNVAVGQIMNPAVGAVTGGAWGGVGALTALEKLDIAQRQLQRFYDPERGQMDDLASMFGHQPSATKLSPSTTFLERILSPRWKQKGFAQRPSAYNAGHAVAEPINEFLKKNKPKRSYNPRELLKRFSRKQDMSGLGYSPRYEKLEALKRAIPEENIADVFSSRSARSTGRDLAPYSKNAPKFNPRDFGKANVQEMVSKLKYDRAKVLINRIGKLRSPAAAAAIIIPALAGSAGMNWLHKRRVRQGRYTPAPWMPQKGRLEKLVGRLKSLMSQKD
jgi:hypothetical protein